MAVTHTKVSAIADSGNTDLVQPSDWNASHAIDADGITLGTGGPSISSGAGDPEGSVTAEPGSLYLRTTGVVYLKQTGSADTGWVEFIWSD